MTSSVLGGYSPIADARSKLRSYWTEVHHIFKRRSQIMAVVNGPWELRYFNPFWNAKATNESEPTDFADFGHKIGCYGNVP